SRVLVPLGRASVQGLVFSISQSFVPHSGRGGFSHHDLREIVDLVDAPGESTLDPSLLKLASQVGDYYVAPPGAALRLVLPPSSPNRTAKRIVLTDIGKQTMGQTRLSAEQSTVLQRLAKAPKGLTMATLLKTIDGNKSVMAGLKRRKLVQEIEWVRVASEKTTISQGASADLLGSLSDHGSEVGQDGGTETLRLHEGNLPDLLLPWWRQVRDALSAKRFDESLLTVSRSIREQCLVKCIHETLSRQRMVLVLCPEIQRVSGMGDRLRELWGAQVGIFHGGLSVSVRSQFWQDIQSGRYRIVVGTRSAVFLPLAQVGLIWVEQEEDFSYQEEQRPSYHARVVARMRAKLDSAVLVLGSTHPSMETVYAVTRENEAFVVHELHHSDSSTLEVVNLRNVPYGVILSDRMIKGMRRALDVQGQVVLFVNRKGFSRALSCRDCGHILKCPRCEVTLILYQNPVRMKCSLCGSLHEPPEACPACQSIRLEASGYGTERVEALVRKKFPDACVVRFDRETVKTHVQETAILENIRKEEIDIVIGTEMLFSAQSFPPMQFVGIPNADAGLHFPDFRAAERTYHRLIQAVQLSDKNNTASDIVLQTLLPTHHVIRAVTEADPIIFYREELHIRQVLNYPPYSALIHVAILGNVAEQVKSMAMQCRERLVAMESKANSSVSVSTHISGSSDSILGPLLSPRAKNPHLTRYILIVKDSDRAHMQKVVKRMQDDLMPVLKRQRLIMEIHVDPADMQ
ncbi:MAG: replication restart helicase PriA, partial [Nitrospirales bacterium]